eukprot:scaffold2706_cov415-Prasinococcus_capsulatus_cf.AAC.6
MLSLVLFSALVYFAERGSWREELICEAPDGLAVVVREAGYYRGEDCMVRERRNTETRLLLLLLLVVVAALSMTLLAMAMVLTRVLHASAAGGVHVRVLLVLALALPLHPGVLLVVHRDPHDGGLRRHGTRARPRETRQRRCWRSSPLSIPVGIGVVAEPRCTSPSPPPGAGAGD